MPPIDSFIWQDNSYNISPNNSTQQHIVVTECKYVVLLSSSAFRTCTGKQYANKDPELQYVKNMFTCMCK